MHVSNPISRTARDAASRCCQDVVPGDGSRPHESADDAAFAPPLVRRATATTGRASDDENEEVEVDGDEEK